jgi:hypothetical protein
VCKQLSVPQPAKIVVVEPTHQDLSSQLGTGAHIFFEHIPGFNRVILSVVKGISVN